MTPPGLDIPARQPLGWPEIWNEEVRESDAFSVMSLEAVTLHHGEGTFVPKLHPHRPPKQ